MGTKTVTKISGRDMEAEETTETATTELENWEKVVDLVQAEFGEGRMPEEATWKVVILIHNGVGYY